MKKPIFIDGKINILTGNQAIEALRRKNDKQFYNENKGVVRVSLERWKTAQACEKKHWMVKGLKYANDRNDYHFEQFNRYKDIKNKTFNSMLEIGCGPFTNTRIIASVCNIEKCSLLDPLIFDYINHPFCSYDQRYLYSEFFPLMGKIIRKFIPFAFKSYQKILTQKISIKNLFNSPFEKMIPDSTYDLVAMINVIEHCYDAGLVFQNILQITDKDSYFVFEDKIYNAAETKNMIEIKYDAAHPLNIDRMTIEKFLYENFDTVFKRIQPNSLKLEGEEIIWEDIYFIGKRSK
jgi:SAM-dependent methyltransferase